MGAGMAALLLLPSFRIISDQNLHDKMEVEIKEA
jgi:hypothetical protein